MTNDDKDLKCPDYVESAFRKWFEYSPCFICGYKGGGYYQIKDHPCAEHYHNRTLSKLWDMDGNPIQHSLSGGPQQPSENQTYIDHNTGETICASCGTHFPKQHPSEPLKELDEKAILMVLDQCCPVSMDKMAKEMIAQILWNKFGQPSEKKALSLNNIYEIIKRCDKNFNPEEDDEGDRHYIATLSEEFCDFMAKAIHSALPAQREVR